MPYIDPKIVAEAKQMDLLTYLRNFEPGELVHLRGDTYSTKSHDSLKISNGKWMWWSENIGGKSALDYLIKVRGIEFAEAVEIIAGKQIAPMLEPISKAEKTEPKTFTLPGKTNYSSPTIQYLGSRGISYNIIMHCLDDGLIWKNAKYNSTVFVGYDEQKKPRYASYRGHTKDRVMGEVTGSDKRYSFRLDNGVSEEVHLFESSIDLLSYATLMELSGREWKSTNLISISGIHAKKNHNESQDESKDEDSKLPLALQNYLESHPETKQIFIHFDFDPPGIKAARRLEDKLKEKFSTFCMKPNSGKDVNDDLCNRLGIQRTASKERSQER